MRSSPAAALRVLTGPQRARFFRPLRPRPGAKRRVALVGSSGGHLIQLVALAPAWSDLDRFWVTFEGPDSASLLEGERRYWCYQPTNRNVPNLLRNSWLALKILATERPTHIVSTGAAVAVPFFYLGRVLGARLVYVEVFDRIETPTLTGRLVQPIADHLFVQWPEQLGLYRRAELLGPLL